VPEDVHRVLQRQINGREDKIVPKLYAVKVEKCEDCPAVFSVANICRANMEGIDPIMMIEAKRANKIPEECPLPEYKGGK
jgi:hypothetical protein